MKPIERIKRLEKIKKQNSDTQIKVRVIWGDTVLDDDGQELTLKEYAAKYKGDPNHIIVGFPDNEDDDKDDITRINFIVNSKDKKE